ncbi:unnamed protein product [Mytilus coruscus]|uniref:Uncharacterized protein n=1 Tax=Mytilus coruscus TaxID=42192 RepID=A0A6J8BS16_MYTCO|nr:unnamed protein product [Mytilus coruscus]
MEELLDHRCLIQQMILDERTHQDISQHLTSLGIRHASARTISRFCSENGIARRCGVDEGALNHIVAECVKHFLCMFKEEGSRVEWRLGEVGSTYGQKMMTGHLSSKGINVSEARVGNALATVNPRYHHLRQQAEKMSLSTLRVPYRIIQYDKKAFPRFQQTQQRIKDIVQNVTYSIDKYAKEWTLKTEDPHIVLCYGTSPPAIDINEFAVLNVPLEKQKNHTLKSISDEAVPVLLICVIKRFSSGGLMYDDCSMLNGIRNLPNNILENALFVIDRSGDSLTAASVFDISEKITAEMKLHSNDIYHRVFRISDSNIGIRASLYFEKQMLDRYRTNKSRLQHTVRCLSRFEIYLTEKEFFEDYETFLHDGPFHYQNSWRFIRDAAKVYQWDGTPTTRNKWTVDKAKNDVAHYICDKFGNHIAEALIEHFESDLKAADLDISNYLSSNIDVSGIRQAFFTFVVFYLFEMIYEGVKTVLAVVTTFIFPENLNSWSFRYNVADKVHDQIMEKRLSLIRGILGKFRDLQFSRLQEIRRHLNHILRVTVGRPESRNEMDCYYHELKMIASRRDHILAIGYDGGKFCVYVQNRSFRAPEIYNYLSSYLKNVGQVEICEFKSISVNEFAKLQSGDKIVRCPLNNKYGTLGFLLRDEKDCYCATCRHVTAGSDANKLHVKLLDGSIITATDKYEPSSKLDFAVLKLDITCLSGYTCYTGVRNKYEKLVPGRVFMTDEFTLNPKTPVYKWGSTTTLTLGLYKETYEILERTEDSYPWIIIANDNNRNNVSFAESGDSGSLVCFTGRDSEVALCLVIGSYSDPGTFACCRIADGLSLIKKEISDINHLFHD